MSDEKKVEIGEVLECFSVALKKVEDGVDCREEVEKAVGMMGEMESDERNYVAASLLNIAEGYLKKQTLGNTRVFFKTIFEVDSRFGAIYEPFGFVLDDFDVKWGKQRKLREKRAQEVLDKIPKYYREQVEEIIENVE